MAEKSPFANVIPRRKPDPQVQLSKEFFSSQGDKFPLASGGFDPNRLLFTDFGVQRGRGVSAGFFMPEQNMEGSIFRRLLEAARAPESVRDKFERGDVVHVTRAFGPTRGHSKESPPLFMGTTVHEFRHRGLNVLGKGKDGDALKVKLPTLVFGRPGKVGTSILDEEDYVRLLDAATDVQQMDDVEEYFRKLRDPPVPDFKIEDVLRDDKIVRALLKIQKQAALASGNPSAIHFPDDDFLNPTFPEIIVPPSKEPAEGK